MYATRQSSNQPDAITLPVALRATRQSTFPSQVVDLTFLTILTLQFHAQARLSNLKLSPQRVSQVPAFTIFTPKKSPAHFSLPFLHFTSPDSRCWTVTEVPKNCDILCQR